MESSNKPKSNRKQNGLQKLWVPLQVLKGLPAVEFTHEILDFLNSDKERTEESLGKALQLDKLAERVFPELGTLLWDEMQATKRYTTQQGLLPPEAP